MRARPTPRNFIAGELAPWLDGLPGEMTGHGCRTIENFIVKKQGAIQRRPGTFYVNEVKASASQTILVQCEIDSSNIYVLEMGNAYCRFYKNHVQVSLAAAAYEVATPYSTGDLTDLRWAYVPNEKSLYFSHHNYPIQKLAWTSDNSWTMTALGVVATKDMLAMDSSGRSKRTSNGLDWEFGSFPMTPYGVEHGKNHYIEVDYSSGSTKINISDDGDTWVAGSLPGQPYNSVQNIAGTKYGQFGIVSGGVSGTIYVSQDDGITWVSKQLATAPYFYTSINVDRTKGWWRVAGNFGSITMSAYSTDGLTFVSIAESGTKTVSNIKSDGSKWVALEGTPGHSWTAASLAAPWTNSTTIGVTLISSVLEFGKVNSVTLWVVAGGASTTATGLIYISSTATAWTKVWDGEGANTRVDSIRFFGGTFYAFTDNEQTYGILTSTDGVTWARRIISQNNPFSYTFATAIDYNDNIEDFSLSYHFPKCIGFDEGRLITAGTDLNPATIWGSGVSDIHNFHIGDFSDQAFSYDLAADKNVVIQWIMGGQGGIVIGTRTGEGILIGSVDEGITPQTARMQWLSTFGSDNIQPVRVGHSIIFTQRGGEIVRGYVPSANADQSPDLTQYADHIASGGVTEIDHQDDPQTIAWFTRADGQALGLTFEANARAWWRVKMGATAGGVGVIESIAVIPTSGAEDEVWAIIKWTVGGSTKRYIVYFDTIGISSKETTHQLDCGYYNSSAGSATVFAAVVPQLAGEAVWATINGNVVEKNLTAGTGGTVTIAATNATKVHIGLPYTSYAQTMRIDQNSAWGSGAGLSKRNGNLNAWVYQTIGGEFGPTSSITETVVYSSTTELTTDLLSVNFPGQWDKDGYIWCIQRDPLPMTVVAVAPDMEMGDR